MFDAAVDRSPCAALETACAASLADDELGMLFTAPVNLSQAPSRELMFTLCSSSASFLTSLQALWTPDNADWTSPSPAVPAFRLVCVCPDVSRARRRLR